MTDLERFLAQATRGLWGRDRRTVRQELESHVRHRAARYALEGLGDTEAIRKAIADLGEPRAISAQMRGVYSIPNGIRAGVLFAVLSVLGFIGTAQVAQITSFPTPSCLKLNTSGYRVNLQADTAEATFAFSCEQDILWIAMASLRPALEPLGVRFEPAGNDRHTVRFPEGRPLTIVNDGGIMVFDFVQTLSKTGLPVTIQGWDNPTVTVGKVAFTLGTTDRPVTGNSVYATLLYRDLFPYFPGLVGSPLVRDTAGNSLFEQLKNHLRPDMPRFSHTIRTTLEPGTVVAVLSKETFLMDASKIPPGERYPFPNGTARLDRAFLAPVASDGTVKYESSSRSLEVVNTNSLRSNVLNGPATITVLRFTGALNQDTVFEELNPSLVKIESKR